MAKGYYLVQGDMTTCGGKIVDGASDHRLFGKGIACERDRVTCGQHPGMYMIAGGIANDTIHGRKMAGTLDSTSSCPCRARFVPSMMQDTYETASSASQSAIPVADDTEFQMRLAGAMATGSQYEFMETSEPSGSDTGAHELVEPEHITDADREPYRALEREYASLFEDRHIQQLPENEDVVFDDVEDVDMDETKIITNISGRHKSLGTRGLGPCIAVCAYGWTLNNSQILGLSHYSGLAEPEDMLDNIDSDMRAAGATRTEYYLIGGMIMPGGRESGSLQTEEGLLSLRDQYNIKGVRLHLSEGTEDESEDESEDEDK
uniref:PAAR domain-containing protein n=1 Tax=Buttiauxella sp. S19-1 TaxID=941430 RepID=UPI001EDB6CCB